MNQEEYNNDHDLRESKDMHISIPKPRMEKQDSGDDYDEKNQNNNNNDNIQFELQKRQLAQEFDQENHNILKKQQKLTPIPRKIIFTVSTLFLVGVILWILALTDVFGKGVTRTQMDLSFIIMGSLLLIPGIFYGLKLIQISLSDDEQVRQEILSEFPLEPED